MRAFLLLFLLFPVLELFVFVKVSAAIGFFPALLLIIAGFALGVLVMRVAGLATALRARESLQRGELPAEDMFQGMMLAVGGGLLLLPGFISDVLGLVCSCRSPVIWLRARCASVPRPRPCASERSRTTRSRRSRVRAAIART